MATATDPNPTLPPCECCGTPAEVTKIGFPSRQTSEDYHCNRAAELCEPCGFALRVLKKTGRLG